MKKNKMADLFAVAQQAFDSRDYKRAFSSLNKFKRAKTEIKFEHVLLEAKVNLALKKFEKALLFKTAGEQLAVSAKQKVEWHNYVAEIYQARHQVEGVIYHLEQSLALDKSIANAVARHRLLTHYVQQEQYDKAREVGYKLLDWQGYFISAAFLLMDCVFATDDKTEGLKLAKSLTGHSDYLAEKEMIHIFNKLLKVKAIDEAQLFVEKEKKSKGVQYWHQIAQAIILVHQQQISRAITLFKEIKGAGSIYEMDFHRALRDFYFNARQESQFFALAGDFHDDYFNLVYLEEYVSLEEHDKLITYTVQPGIAPFLHCMADYNKLISYWLLGRLDDCVALLRTNKEFISISHQGHPKHLKIPHIFMVYIQALVRDRLRKKPEAQVPGHQVIYVIGESHALGLHDQIFRCGDSSYQGRVKFIKGIQMHHLAGEGDNKYKYYLRRHLGSIEDNASVLFTIGEIDCRIGKGLSLAAKKLRRPLDELIDQTVKGYIEYIKLSLQTKPIKKVYIQGIPAPNIEKYPWLDLAGHVRLIQKVNVLLKSQVLAQQWFFIDVYAATSDVSGWSHGKRHLDACHLKPSLYEDVTAWIASPQ
ncbi:tetratricopeptide repeat protein [Thalassomonas actiniarum]|uniref:Tetratricopeptide repeat protein n=1 Tax=Thalassomonas actiniarum TaxID=485447 RepID=A0AAE9YTJ5_9GAMM|nr:tetratricopeptide repeat protein [Thalassomonas actiniarum]WDE00528.1 tetratricopeptide repeat protein [Thalassomonas actiniarum]